MAVKDNVVGELKKTAEYKRARAKELRTWAADERIRAVEHDNKADLLEAEAEEFEQIAESLT